jgi:hypothetical protein
MALTVLGGNADAGLTIRTPDATFEVLVVPTKQRINLTTPVSHRNKVGFWARMVELTRTWWHSRWEGLGAARVRVERADTALGGRGVLPRVPPMRCWRGH